MVNKKADVVSEWEDSLGLAIREGERNDKEGRQRRLCLSFLEGKLKEEKKIP